MAFLRHLWWLNKMALEITPLIWWLVIPLALAGIAMLATSRVRDSWEDRYQSLWGLASLLFPLAILGCGVAFVASPVRWYEQVPMALLLSEVAYVLVAVWRARTCRWFTTGVAMLSVAYSVSTSAVASMSITDVWP